MQRLSEEKNGHSLEDIERYLCDEKQRGNKAILNIGLGKASVEVPKVRGREIFTRMQEMIANAEEEVLLVLFKIYRNCVGENFLIAGLKALSEKAQRDGRTIQVRLLVNSLKGAGRTFFGNEGINQIKGGLSFPNLNIEYCEHTHYFRGSYHQKMLLIDGKSALLPSCDISTKNNFSEEKMGRVDNATILHGESLVRHLRADFIQAFRSKHNKKISSTTTQTDFIDTLETQEGEFKQSTESPSEFPALFFSRKSQGGLTNHYSLSPYALALIQSINKAQHDIYIMTGSLNEHAIIEALAAAARRGIKIYIIMGRNKDDRASTYPCGGGTNQENVKRLLNKSGQNNQNVTVRWATDDSKTALARDDHLHAKLAVIDDLVFVGSSVMDVQSTRHSREADVIIQSKKVAEMQLNKVFYPQFNKGLDARKHFQPTFTEKYGNSILSGMCIALITSLIVMLLISTGAVTFGFVPAVILTGLAIKAGTTSMAAFALGMGMYMAGGSLLGMTAQAIFQRFKLLFKKSAQNLPVPVRGSSVVIDLTQRGQSFNGSNPYKHQTLQKTAHSENGKSINGSSNTVYVHPQSVLKPTNNSSHFAIDSEEPCIVRFHR